jgi:flagellin
MIASSNSLSLHSSNIPTSTSNLSSSTTSTDASSSTTISTNEIQKKSDSLSLSSSSYILDDSLRVRTNSVEIAYSEASKGAALSEVTNKALDYQSKLLSNVSDKLQYILKNETTDVTQEIIRKDIHTLLDQFDEIAADSNYQELYSLQESNSNTDTSTSHSFRISEFPPIVLSTESIQSNTEGLGLSDLKNLVEDGLKVSVANDQSKVVISALESIEQFQSDYQTLLKSLKTSTNSLSDLHKSFEKSNENTKEINFQAESLVFDRNKILKEMGAFSQAQANALQSNVLDLLSFDSNSLNSFNTLNTSDTIKNTFTSNKEENI